MKLLKCKWGIALIVLLTSGYATGQENCSNAIDDDGDGLIDLNDNDCTCSEGMLTPFSFINNPNFEELSGCPDGYSDLHLATGWSQPSNPTTDFMHTCDFIPSYATGANLIPFPSGSGAGGSLALVDWREYFATCLNTTLLAGTSYTLKMFIGVNYGGDVNNGCGIQNNTLAPLPWAIFGQSNCADNDFFIDNTQGFPYNFCPPTSEGFIQLSAATIPFDGEYHEVTFTFTPTTDINGLVIGPGCNLPPGYPSQTDLCSVYAVVDSLILNTTSSFGALITSSGALCTEDLILTANGLIQGGTYQWYQNGIALIGETNPSLELSNLDLSDGLYQIAYSVNGECSINTFTVSPSVLPAVNVNNKSICPNDSATLTATGAVTYTWSPPTGLSGNTGNQVTASPNITTTYTVTGTSNNGCSNQTEVTVTVLTPPTVTIDNPVIQTCVGDIITYNASGAIDYVWNEGIQNNVGFVAEEGIWNYEVVGFDVNGCTDTESLTLVVSSYPNIVLGDASPTEGVAPLVVEFMNLSQGADSYTWNFGNNLSSTDIGNVSTTYSEGGDYVVTLIGSHEGCTAVWTDTIMVLTKSPIVVLPNIFSPNGDGVNDSYSIIYNNISSIEGVIINRWGEVVYKFNQADFVWDGSNVTDGVYTIVYNAISDSGEVLNDHNFIHVIRD